MVIIKVNKGPFWTILQLILSNSEGLKNVHRVWFVKVFQKVATKGCIFGWCCSVEMEGRNILRAEPLPCIWHPEEKQIPLSFLPFSFLYVSRTFWTKGSCSHNFKEIFAIHTNSCCTKLQTVSHLQCSTCTSWYHHTLQTYFGRQEDLGYTWKTIGGYILQNVENLPNHILWIWSSYLH